MKKKQQIIGRNAQKAFLSLLIAAVLSLFAWTVHETAGVQLPLQNNAAEVYASENGEDLRQLYRKAIESAQSSILLLVYTLTDESIIHSLREKANQGVKVRVIVDAKASPHSAKKLGPSIDTLRRFGPGLMHAKILVIDDMQVLVGSANMTADSFQMHSNLVLGISNSELASFIVAKSRSLTEADKSMGFPHKKLTIGGQPAEFWFLPDDGQAAIGRIKDLMRTAKKTIRVAMFTWTRLDFAHEIIRAAKRGVKVEVVIDQNSGKGASAQVVKLLKDSHINVHLSKGPGLLHHKFMEVDSRVLVNGSANWTKAAFRNNDDCFIVLAELTPAQTEKLDDEWQVLYSSTAYQKF